MENHVIPLRVSLLAKYNGEPEGTGTSLSLVLFDVIVLGTEVVANNTD